MVLVPARPPTSPQRLGYLRRYSRERLKPSSVFSLLLSRLRYFEEGRYWKRNQLETERERAKGEEERRLRYVCSNIYTYTSYHSDIPRHKSVVADNCRLFCRPCGYQAKDRNILHRHQGSGRHKRKIQEMFPETDESIDRSRLLFATVWATLLRRGAILEEKSIRNRERGGREREREDYFENIYRQVRYYTPQQLQLLIVFLPTNSCKSQTNLLYRAPAGSVPTRPPANIQSTGVVYSIQAPVLNGDRGSV